jgi:hypothetical protein
MHGRKRISTVLLPVLAAMLAAAPASAGVFNPNLIIADDEMRDHDALSYEEVHRFLVEKGGMAEKFDVDPIDGLLKNPAQLIVDASVRYRVNPKYLLALLQKESGIVEAKKPTQKQLDWAAGYALCDGCSKKNPLAVKYRGLGKQIDAGAGWMDWYYQNFEKFKTLKKQGVTYTISKTKVTPLNKTTAALYSYTPHLHGNRLLWSIWNRWFETGTYSLQYPDGTLVRNEKTGAVALIQNGKLRPIVSASVLQSRFNAANIVDLNEYDFAALENLKLGSPVKFADYSLVRTEDGGTFLLAGAKRRRIASPEVFAAIGFNPEEVEDVTGADIAEYAEGEPITMTSSAPAAKLAQDKKTGGVYAVEDGVKHPIWDKALLQANFPGRPIVPTAPEELAALPTGEPVAFIDGTLVRQDGQPAVYVVSGGKKRLIPSEDAFNAFGYRWESILVTSEKALALNQTGDPLTIDAEEIAPKPIEPAIIF